MASPLEVNCCAAHSYRPLCAFNPWEMTTTPRGSPAGCHARKDLDALDTFEASFSHVREPRVGMVAEVSFGESVERLLTRSAAIWTGLRP